MNKIKFKKGDMVLLKTGKDGGKTGKISSVDRTNKKVIVEGRNIYKKNAKPSSKYPQGGIIDIAKPVDISNLRLICPNCKKTTRITIIRKKDSVTRGCKRCNEVLDVK